MSEQPRPTADIRRVDLSASRPGASAEAALIYAYRSGPVTPRYRTESCMCGGDIRAEVGWEFAAVEDHNATLQHQVYRRRVVAWLGSDCE